MAINKFKIMITIAAIISMPVLVAVIMTINSNIVPKKTSGFEEGIANLREGKFNDAIKVFSKELAQENTISNPPKDVWYLFRAQSYNAIEEYQLALNDADSGLMLNPRSRALAVEKANAHCGLKEYNLALEEIKRIIQLLARSDVSDPSLYSLLAKIYSYKGDFISSIETYNKLLEIDPASAKQYLSARDELIKSQAVSG